MTAPVLRRSRVLVAAGVLLVVLAACSDDEGQPAAQPTAPSPVASAPLPGDPASVQSVIRSGTRSLKAGMRRFERCDEKAVVGYGFNSCWPRTAAATAAAGEFAQALRALGPPPELATLVARLDRLADAGPAVRKGCRTRDDQTCDSALMRFRNDAQQVMWELDSA